MSVEDNAEKSSCPPMTSQEAREWAKKTEIEFGKHSGKTVCRVPLGYLLWLDRELDFRRDLHRYLASPRVQEEIEYGDKYLLQEEIDHADS